MNTRGGVSKAQKGLHLNEDIYAGMTAFGRGGRIKHSEYYQVGRLVLLLASPPPVADAWGSLTVWKGS